jgi:hypothetical protein
VATPSPAAQYLAAQGNRRRRKEFHIALRRSGEMPEKH